MRATGSPEERQLFTQADLDAASGYGAQPVRPVLLPADNLAREEEGELNLVEYLSLIWSRKWLVLIIMILTTTITGVWTGTRPKKYRAYAEIAVGGRPPQIVRNQLNLGPSWWELERYVEEQVRVLGSRHLAQRVSERLGLTANRVGADAASTLQSMISVQRIGDTNMVMLTLTSLNPEQAAAWLNLYIEEYADSSVVDTLARTRKVYEIIQERLDPLRDDLERSAQELMQFKEREDAILFADQDKNVISEQVNTLTTEYANAKAERIRLETRISALERVGSAELTEAAFPEFLQSPAVQNLVTRRHNLELELAQKLEVYREGHPEIKELRSQLAETEERIAEQISSNLSALQADFEMALGRERSLFRNIQELKEQSIELSKQTMEYERIKREYEQNKTFLEDMMARSKEVDISSTTSSNNVRVIEPAVAPKAPFTPNLQRALLIAGMLGLFLGVGLVLGLDFLDQSLRTPEEVERYLGLDVLTVLPKYSDKLTQVGREALLALRTALMLAARDEDCQVLMITSAVPGEGKTTVSLELAKVLAESGSRTLVIDADLRKSRVHRVLGTENITGITSVVLGECRLDEVIHSSGDGTGLDYITSGPLPPNPPELYGKPSFARLLSEARKTYDWVLIDTPPIASVTDPVICSRLVDMVLLVVQYRGVKRQTVREAIRQLARADSRLVGTLLNKVDMEQHHYYYYSRYSYYRYGYSDHEQA